MVHKVRVYMKIWQPNWKHYAPSRAVFSLTPKCKWIGTTTSCNWGETPPLHDHWRGSTSETCSNLQYHNRVQFVNSIGARISMLLFLFCHMVVHHNWNHIWNVVFRYQLKYLFSCYALTIYESKPEKSSNPDHLNFIVVTFPWKWGLFGYSLTGRLSISSCAFFVDGGLLDIVTPSVDLRLCKPALLWHRRVT